MLDWINCKNNAYVLVKHVEAVFIGRFREKDGWGVYLRTIGGRDYLYAVADTMEEAKEYLRSLLEDFVSIMEG